MPSLELTGFGVAYAGSDALRGVDLSLASGELLWVVGRNGSGRSSLLRGLMGLASTRGTARLDGQALGALAPWEIARLGVGYAPDTREVFGTLSVRENLMVVPARAQWCTAAELLDRFPPLRTRARVAAGRLSGGEQKLLAIARAALGATRLLLVDEPYEGLAAPMCDAVDALLGQALRAGVAVICTDRGIERLAAQATAWLVLGAGEPRHYGPPTAGHLAFEEWMTE